MSLSKPAYRSKLYRDFKSLEGASVHSRIRFFESHEKAIRQLEDMEFSELLFAYAEALFQAGAFAKYKVVADEVIACCMERHVTEFRGEDIFLNSIFRKAVACYHLQEYDQAVHLFKELLRMDPSNPGGRLGLRRTLYRMKPEKVLSARAVSVLLLLAAAFITAVELLFVRYFFSSWVKTVEWTRIGLFLLGVLVLLGSDLYQRRRAFREVARFSKEMEMRKQSRKKIEVS
ncbi:MAG: tetratricopeptide repeat protein [Saprospirales bacterium]|nr:tetratricopeptide repeat protein [Saprospirales bacterium]